MSRIERLLAALLVLGAISSARAQEASWDGLRRVASKRLQYVYLLPGADFRQYRKVTIDPPQVAFRKDWAQDVNRGERDPSRMITQSDVQRIQKALSEGFEQALSTDFTKAGWQVVKAPGPDVLHLTPFLLDVDANPQRTSEGRADTYTVEPGRAAVGLEVRDSDTNQLLGRVVDRQETQSFGGKLMISGSVTNRADFGAMLQAWSRVFVEGLATLKGASPIGASAQQK